MLRPDIDRAMLQAREGVPLQPALRCFGHSRSLPGAHPRRRAGGGSARWAQRAAPQASAAPECGPPCRPGVVVAGGGNSAARSKGSRHRQLRIVITPCPLAAAAVTPWPSAAAASAQRCLPRTHLASAASMSRMLFSRSNASTSRRSSAMHGVGWGGGGGPKQRGRGLSSSWVAGMGSRAEHGAPCQAPPDACRAGRSHPTHPLTQPTCVLCAAHSSHGGVAPCDNRVHFIRPAGVCRRALHSI